MKDQSQPSKPSWGPDFICIGAQKAGTTWLYSNLKAHPGVWFPPFKEVHYFDQVHLDFKINLPIHQAKKQLHQLQHKLRAKAIRMKLEETKARPEPTLRQQKKMNYLKKIIRGPLNDQWYSRLYSRGRGKKQGDITPSYCMIGERGISHVKALCPDVRLIYLIRDPMDRLLSSLRMSAGMGRVDFDELLKSEQFLSRGEYSNHIPLWEKTFGNQIKYLPFGAIREKPLETLHAVEDFIGVERFDGYSHASEAKNVGEKIDFSDDLLKIAAKLTERQYQFLADKFGNEFLRAIK